MEKRRQFLKKLFGFMAGTSLFLSPLFSMIQTALAKTARTILPKGTKRETLIDKNPAELDARDLEITPLDKFGTMGLSDQKVNLEQWRLEVTGLVKNPLRLRYDEILSMPFIEKNVLLICPGVFANYGTWKGLSIGTLLKEAQAEKEATHVTVYGPEGEYEKTQRYPLAEILANKVFLAYQVNGKALPQRHGFPLRAVAEDYYGFDWIKYAYKINVEKV